MKTAALTWVKSSYSGSQGGDCVEVAAEPACIHIRDSKHPGGPVLTVSPSSWSGFVDRVAAAGLRYASACS
ncbi:DUF397 domain-containing protein [Streptomyces sp. NPDC007851]|uniref:DUF397 domain-containing protein n=1 Tax=Streptomyces sp. NPDC007851 TaxID=3155008 RepID=UPI003410FAE5